LILENAGLHVELVADGSQLVKRFEQTKPDAVLVDVMMPELNGVEAIKAIRALEGGRDVPIIAVTSSFVPEFIKGTKEAGANTILSKMEMNPALLIKTLKLFLFTGSQSVAA
jgi:CheY-like chemotaxis protein